VVTILEAHLLHTMRQTVKAPDQLSRLPPKPLPVDQTQECVVDLTDGAFDKAALQGYLAIIRELQHNVGPGERTLIRASLDVLNCITRLLNAVLTVIDQQGATEDLVGCKLFFKHLNSLGIFS